MTVTAVIPAMIFATWLFGTSVTLANAKSPGSDDTSKRGQVRVGMASFYGKGLNGGTTAGGEKFDKNAITAAHPSYPLGTVLMVTNLSNGRTLKVRVNDRGPVAKHQRQGVIIDLSEGAAKQLGFKGDGKTRVKTQVIEWGEGPAKDSSTSRRHSGKRRKLN